MWKQVQLLSAGMVFRRRSIGMCVGFAALIISREATGARQLFKHWPSVNSEKVFQHR